MIFTGTTWHLDCAKCGAPLVPPFALVGDNPMYALCPQPGCGARTRVFLRGDTLLGWVKLGEYVRETGRQP